MILKIIRHIAVLSLMAAIILYWLNLYRSGTEPAARFIMVVGGASLALLGVLYKLLGSWDLIPDWIPILGSVDDFVAWLAVFAGIATGCAGWFLF